MHPDWLGSPQHFVGGAVLAAVLACGCRTHGSRWLVAALAVGLTLAAECLIEVAGYPLLYAGDVHLTAYYDTVADIASTVVGALVGAAGFLAVSRKAGYT